MLVLQIPSWLHVSLKSAKQAATEFLFICLLALMPLWLGSFVKLVTAADPFSYLNGYLFNGEALLLCSSLIGPLIYTIILDDKDGSGNIRPFPFRSSIFFIILVVCIISAVVFALGNQNDMSRQSPLDASVIWIVSAIITCVSLIIWFFVAIVRKNRESGAPTLMRQGTAEFLKEFQEAGNE